MANDPTQRPMVQKHLETFRGYMIHPKIGAEKVRGALKSKDGHYKDVRIKFTLSRKDRHGLLIALGLE